MAEQTRVSCDNVPLETITALHDLMIACVEYWPDPADTPEPIRKALGPAVRLWLDSVGDGVADSA